MVKFRYLYTFDDKEQGKVTQCVPISEEHFNQINKNISGSRGLVESLLNRKLKKNEDWEAGPDKMKVTKKLEP